MKAKKWLTLCGTAVMLAVLVTGCKSSVETEEEIITLKEEEGGNAKDEALAGAEEGQQAKSPEAGELGGIAEQVQAPERYTADLSAENITVKVDAPVLVPTGEGFKTYRVKSRPFEQADYDAVSHVLLKDAGLWERDQDAMAASRGLTREEIEQRVMRRETEIAEAEAAGTEALNRYEAEAGKDIEVIKEELEKLKEMQEGALEEPVIVEVPAIITVDDGNGRTQDENAGWLNGYATVDGEDYFVAVNNAFREDWCWNTFEVIKKDEEIGYFPNYYSYVGVTEEQKENAGFSIDEIRAKAVEAVAAMGFTDFIPSGEKYFAIHDGEGSVGKIGYGIYFTRTFEGVPVTYTDETGTMMEDEYSAVWPYENMTLVYNEDGIVNFVWGNPYEVEKVSDEYSFLLPFAEIQNIFEEMIIKKYQDWMDGRDDMKMDFRIEEVRLGYMRVREKDNADEAAMVPVWDFLGTQDITYDSADSSYSEGTVFNSRITINALDGTIIDRNFGY